MGREDYLPHYILGVKRNVNVDGQVTDQARHCRQFFGMNAIFRLFDANQPLCFRIFSQHGESEKPQSTIGDCAGGKFLPANFRDRKREQLANLVANHIDVGHGHELCQAR